MLTRSEDQPVGALDELTHQDVVLKSLLDQVDWERDGGVEARYDFGNLAKEIIRHIGDREAAAMDVAHGIEGVESLSSAAHRMIAADLEIRHLYADAGRMSRGIEGIDLNTGQDFDRAFRPLVDAVHAEVTWELDGGLATIEEKVGEIDGFDRFHSARWLQHHAPTTLDEGKERWYERTPVIPHFLTLWDHMRDYPRAARSQRRR